MWLLRCAIFAPIPWKPCTYCMAGFCGSTGTPKSPGFNMQHTFREEGEFLSLQRLPGHARATHVQPITRSIDPTIHTADHPFCYDPACSCHSNQEAMQRVQQWVEQGLLTEDEATEYIAGRTFWVVTLFRSGREGSCQKRDPGPGMRGKPERHGGSARQVASRLRTHQEA